MVRILFFTTAAYQSRNFEIYEGFSNSSNGQRVLYTNNETDGYTFTKDFNPPIVLQYLEVKRNGTLTICEFKIIESGKRKLHLASDYFF